MPFVPLPIKQLSGFYSWAAPRPGKNQRKKKTVLGDPQWPAPVAGGELQPTKVVNMGLIRAQIAFVIAGAILGVAVSYLAANSP